GDCNFEQSFCTWINMAGDQFDWIRGSGSTASSFTGPSRDRLGSSSGYYVFIETSSPRRQGDKARLLSQQFNGTNAGSCFTFWYHMYGGTIGTLNLYQVVGQTETLIWTLSGNKGNSWFSGQVPVGKKLFNGYKVCQNHGVDVIISIFSDLIIYEILPPAERIFCILCDSFLISCYFEISIIAEGVRGSSYTGDIAIDDFKVLNGVSCSIIPTNADPNSPTTSAPVTTVPPTTTPARKYTLV
ncbi:unnamed protein product, partial [Porites evermanni]